MTARTITSKILHIELHGLHELQETLQKMKEAKEPFSSPLGRRLEEELDNSDDNEEFWAAAAPSSSGAAGFSMVLSPRMGFEIQRTFS